MPTFDISIASCTDRGQREVNEDALRIGASGPMHYAVLSDGAGGHARGAEASRRVVDGVESALRRASGTVDPAYLTGLLLSVHADLQRAQIGTEGRGRMHATVVVIWLDGQHDRVVWSHIGDTRLYRLRYGCVVSVTADDSVVQRMVEGGVLTPEQAQDHPMKNQLLAAVGMEDSVEPHTLQVASALEDGDAFLLCTDGWWGMLSEPEMIRTLTDAESPQGWLDAMHGLIQARSKVGQDNFSAVAVWVSDPAQDTQTMDEDDETTIIQS